MESALLHVDVQQAHRKSFGGRQHLKRMLAGSTGLEPAASGVTGRRSNQLNYDPQGLNLTIADF